MSRYRPYRQPTRFSIFSDVDKRMDKNQINNQLISGKNTMPAFALLTEVERNVISGYLFGEQTEIEFATEITPLENGRTLFVANCARCHKTSPNDSHPPEQRDSGMQPGMLDEISTKFKFDEFENIMNTRPCYMPSFESLTKSDKGNIYTYLQTMEDMYVETRTSRSMGCRMSYRNRN